MWGESPGLNAVLVQDHAGKAAAGLEESSGKSAGKGKGKLKALVQEAGFPELPKALN